MGRRIDTGDKWQTDDGLSVELGWMDKAGCYLHHEAIWYATDSPVPIVRRMVAKRTIRAAVPIVWRTAPREIVDALLDSILRSKVNSQMVFPKAVADYMESEEFLEAMRGLLPPTDDRDTALWNAVKNARMLLSDRPRKFKNIRISWRSEPADLNLSPVVNSNYYAQTIWVDPVLKDAGMGVLCWVVYHEFCMTVSLNKCRGIVSKKKLQPLLDRYEGDIGPINDVLDAMNWRLPYDSRFTDGPYFRVCLPQVEDAE